MQGDAYQELARHCRKRRLRLLLCGDRDHSHHSVSTELTKLDICRRDGNLLVRVKLKDRTLDEAAELALTALAIAAPQKRKPKGAT